MSQSIDQVLRKAKRHASKGETDLAAQIFQSVLDKFPKNKRAIEGLQTLHRPKRKKAARQVGSSQGQIDGLIALYTRGKLQEVLTQSEALAAQFPSVAFFPNMLGVVHVDLGQREQAVECYAKALQIDPDFTEAQYNLGTALNDMGRYEEAVAHLTRAVELKPDFAAAHNNLGNALKALGKTAEAVASLTRALAIEPNAAHFHYNLGAAQNALGSPEAALESFARAVEIKPDYAEALNNLGAAQNAIGRPEEAASSLTRAVELRPDFAAAHSNLGAALTHLGKPEEAVAHYRQAVALDPDNNDSWQKFSALLGTVSFEEYNPQWGDIFLELLERKTVVRPVTIVKPVLALLRQHPAISKAQQISVGPDSEETLLEICNGLSEILLLLRILELAPVPDLAMEDLLRKLRKLLLLSGGGTTGGPTILSFQTSLALHCFANEYVFGESEEETAAVRALEAEIGQLFASGEGLDPGKIACLASYRPLHGYGWAHQVAVPESLKELFERQVHNVQEEASIRPEIRTLEQIRRQTSSAVRDQYEENPYPRWENTALHVRPYTIPALARSLDLKLTNDTVTFSDQPEILVAGCGTGQQALATATRFLDCKVLAIDLSLSSLSYAIRKTRELGITNIEYMQADILDLSSLEHQFDIVESSGVLHHMADPVAGWKILTSLLKPGGLMNIGLYSELARQHIVAARDMIAEIGLSNSLNDMLKFRASLCDPKSEAHARLKKITESGAFYSSSELRDLLFHVQEHRFTLPQIEKILGELGLT
ncbi:MAG: tetratricopeptide repeat protein, partial [Verrucomicrobia bacterium]|nr:tetratricopeptide repeat protein [Verrucomicrobiota bacterium]